MPNDQTHNNKVTLESIRMEKQQVLEEIRGRKKNMSTIARTIFYPERESGENGKMNQLMRYFTIGMNLYDGVMTGFKLMKKVRSIFRRR